jgi:uncharacterized protein YkwD
MMKFSTTVAALLMAFLAVILPQSEAWGQLRTKSGAVKSGVDHPKALENRVFHLTNEARRKNGLPPLGQDSQLTALAREQGDRLIKEHRFIQADRQRENKLPQYDREEPAKIGYAGKPGENIHMALKDDYSDIETAARLIVNGLMGSPALRSNILNPTFTHLGVGVCIKGKESYVVQEFGPKNKR